MHVTSKTELRNIPNYSPPSVYTIDELPRELLLYIFSLLPPKDLLVCKKVNVLWKVLSSDASLWERKNRRIFKANENEGNDEIKSWLSTISAGKNRPVRRKFNETYHVGNFLIELAYNKKRLKIIDIKNPNDTIYSDKFFIGLVPGKFFMLKGIDDSHAVIGKENDNYIKVLDLKTGAYTHSKKFDSDILSFTGSDKEVYILLLNGEIIKWDLITDEFTTFIHIEDNLNHPFPKSLMFKDNILCFRTMSEETGKDVLIFWNTEKQEKYRKVTIYSCIINVKISGDFIFVHTSEGIKMLNKKDLKEEKSFSGKSFEFMNNRYFVAIDNGFVKITDLVNPNDQKELKLETSLGFWTLKKSDGLLFCLNDEFGVVHLIDYINGGVSLILPSLKKAAEVYIGKGVIVRNIADKLEIWDIDSSRTKRMVQVKAKLNAVSSKAKGFFKREKKN